MNKKKAIEILQKQKLKLDYSTVYKDSNWTFQTASYIKDFFGKDSTEYIFISKFNFKVLTGAWEDDESINRQLLDKHKKAKGYLENCIETISNKGLYEHPKTNIVSDKSNFELIGIIVAISIFVFGIGYWTKTVELFSVIKQKEEHISLPSDSTTQKISNPKSKSNESREDKQK
jgi:hypothetical protein